MSDTKSRDQDQMLLQYLRLNLELKGTKSNCYGGSTVNCTVLLSKWNQEVEAYEHREMLSCSVLGRSYTFNSITTVEGVGSSKNPHPIQQRLFECNAVQCGYNTPGLVVAAYALLVQRERLTIQEIVKNLDGVVSR